MILKNFCKNKYNSGLTLIELLVVISIFAIITSIVIFNYGKFNSSSSLQNLADDIALTVRKAQGYAVGVRGLADKFNYGYGIHFTKGSSSFILFTDIGNSPGYNEVGGCGAPEAGNECLEILNIISADQIDSISLNDSSGSSEEDNVDIVFKRPNSEPTFCYDNSCDNPVSSVKIRISNTNNPDVYKFVTIFNNGQISVSNE